MVQRAGCRRSTGNSSRSPAAASACSSCSGCSPAASARCSPRAGRGPARDRAPPRHSWCRRWSPRTASRCRPRVVARLGARGTHAAPRPRRHVGAGPARRRRRAGRCSRFRDVDVAYGHVQVVFDLTFDVRREETVALLGTNGAGKSTVLRAASGLLAPDARTDLVRRRRHHRAAPPTASPRGDWCTCPAGAACSRRSPSPRTCAWARGSAATTPEFVRDATERALTLFPGLRDAAARSGRTTCRAGSSRCSRWRWRCSSSRRCC